ncbi:MAG: hypothetical protein H0X36_05415 [Sphingomonadaceae bacterium]|nr:hypothetical protein [Sphingomonadaceae bacterium]
MALADDIELLVGKRPGLTAAQIAESIYGADGYQQKVNSTCRRLLKQGRVIRGGNGYQADPFRYHPGAHHA